MPKLYEFVVNHYETINALLYMLIACGVTLIVLVIIHDLIRLLISKVRELAR